VSFCHHACCPSIWEATAGKGEQREELRDADTPELMEMLSGVREFRGVKGREYALTFILAVCVVALLAGARNYREIATVAAGISQRQLQLMGAEWDYFGNCYRHPRQTVIWTVLTSIDAAELDRITGDMAPRAGQEIQRRRRQVRMGNRHRRQGDARGVDG